MVERTVESYGNPRIAYKLGRSVGLGVPPGRAAVCRYLTPRELVKIRIKYWRDYDRGLLDGREQ